MRRVGVYLVMEWESLPKTECASHFKSVTGETGGGWNVHSTYMMELRKYVAAAVVQTGENLVLERKKAVDKGNKLSDSLAVKAYMVEEVRRKVMWRVQKMLEEEREKKEEADRVMKEFLVSEEE